MSWHAEIPYAEFLIGLLGVVICLVCMGVQAMAVMATRRWNRTAGNISSCEASGGRIVVRYTYTVNNEQYCGANLTAVDLIVPRLGWAPRSRVEAIARRLKFGGNVIVFYDPRCPSRSFLVQVSLVEGVSGWLLLLALCLLVTAIGIARSAAGITVTPY